MGNIALVNTIGIRPPALRPIVNGTSSLDRVLAFAGRLPEVEEVVLLASGRVPQSASTGFQVEQRDSWTAADLLDVMKRRGDGRQDIFYFHGDCPLLDPGLAGRMHENHRKYYADYTYADGYPYGLAPEILTTAAAGRLRALAGDGPAAAARDLLFELIRKDINSFDIETVLAERDQRLLRVTLTADTERNFLLLEKALSLGALDSVSAPRILEENPGILRSLPAFFPVQIVERCAQACSYCPYPLFAGDVLSLTGLMAPERFAVLADRISAFCGDAVIGVSLWGEPALHPAIAEIAGKVLSTPGLDLLIETAGIGWDPAAIARIRETAERQPTWIISLDAAAEGVYRSLRGEGFAEARRTAESLLDMFPGKVHVQAVRMKENEEDLEVFFGQWKTKTENIIIQKHDSFCGMLPDRKVADLSPLRRFPCWHLKRDFPVLLDGTVPLCREEVGRKRVLGNALKDDLAAIWKAGEETYRRHLAAEYPGICAGCDEWYTYNY
jgi:spiro-SPASM protein